MRKPENGKLYVGLNDDYMELSAVAVGSNITPVKKTTIQESIDVYIKLCTLQKSLKNQTIEKTYFSIFRDFCYNKNLSYIDEVKHQDLLEFKVSLGQRMTASSVNRRMCTFKNFFRMCEEWEYLIKSPAHKIKKDPIRYNPRLNWDERDFKKVLGECDTYHASVIKFLLYTGCRPSEMVNLKWDDIDYNNGVIYFECGKNKNKVRKIDLLPEVDAILHSIKPESIWVFSKYHTEKGSADTISHYIRKALRRHGLGHLCVYGLRHTCADIMLKNGFTVFQVNRQLGHTNLTTTMNYCHDENNKKELIEKHNRVLWR